MRIFTTLACLLAVSAWSSDTPKCTQNDVIAWMAHSLQEIETIQIGMNREAVLKVFRPEGGFSTAPREKGTFVYRNSPYIKVDIEFTPKAGGDQTGPPDQTDVVTSISRAYLGQPVYD